MSRMKAPGALMGFLVIAAALAVMAEAPKGDTEPAEESVPAATVAEETAPAASGGVRAVIDPETGELMNRLPDDLTALPGASDRPGPGHWLNTFSDDLYEVPLDNGGFMVDLRGRFRSAVVATIDPESGAAEVDCIVEPAPEKASEEVTEEGADGR